MMFTEKGGLQQNFSNFKSIILHNKYIIGITIDTLILYLETHYEFTH